MTPKNTPKQTNEETPTNTESTKTEDAPKEKNPVRRITGIVLLVALVILLWYILADRHTPYTDQAKFDGLIVPIVPRVAGYITDINVRLHSIVEEGEVIVQLDKRPYEVAVKGAEAEVDNAVFQMGAQSATVKSAAARVGVSKASLDRAQRNYNRVQRVLDDDPGALSQADRDRAETSLESAVERVASAEADLEKAKQQLGAEGPENPLLRAALAALEQAQLDLAFTTLHAPSVGAIESFSLDVGHYAVGGQPLATFISIHDIWIRADMKENNISNIKIGDPAEFALDIAPGRIFKGTVRSIGYGVGSQDSGRGDLPTISSNKGWLRDPQRFPVIIAFDNESLSGLIRYGGQASVVVYTGRRPVLNTIAKIRIRLGSLLSYVR
jgi:multidrug resistance efflux pump